MGSYSRTVFAIFGAIFASLILVSMCTGAGIVVDGFMVVLGAFHTVGSVVQSGSVNPSTVSAVMQSIFNFSNPTLLIAPGIGLALGLLLAILISSALLKRTADVNWLEKHGKRVMAKIKSINPHRGSHTDSNGYTSYYTYYIITAEWVDPQTHYVHTFHSGQLYSPGGYQVGGAVQVWIDPENIDGKNYMAVAS